MINIDNLSFSYTKEPFIKDLSLSIKKVKSFHS